MRCIQVIAGVLGRAGEEGQRKRLEAAKSGHVTWSPPQGLGRPIREEDEKKKEDAAIAIAKAMAAGDAGERLGGSRSGSREPDLDHEL